MQTESTAVTDMDTDALATGLAELDEVNVEECESTESGGYAELSLDSSLRLHVTATEETVSVVLAEPRERQASIVVEDTDN